MGRIGTTYDKELNEKVYVVKGDEAYAHTTEILLTQTGNITQGTSTYTVPFVVSVHRNVGNSTVTIYDNNTAIAVIDCNTADETISYTATLEYGIAHNIYARYNGNNRCTPSKSFYWTDERVNPNLSITTLTQSGSLRFSNDEVATTTVTISEESGTATLDDLTINYIVDGGTIQSTTTDSNGDATITIGDELSNGIHNITVFFDGTSTLASCDIQFQAIVGFSVDIIQYPPAFTNILDWNYGNAVKVQVLDYLGEPVSGGTVSFYNMNKTTNDEGIATFQISNGVGGTYTATYENYASDSVRITEANVTSISLSQSNIVEKGGTTECTWKLNGTGNFKDIYLKLGVQKGAVEILSTSKYTDENGEIKFTYEADGRGEVTAWIGSSSEHQKTATIYDYLQYWKAPTESRNRSTYASYCALQGVTNGWKLKASSGVHRGAMTFTNLPNKFVMQFKVKGTNNYNGLRINDLSYPFKVNDNVRIRQDGVNGSLYVNDTLIGGITSEQASTLKMWVNYNQYSADSYIIFDELRILSL